MAPLPLSLIHILAVNKVDSMAKFGNDVYEFYNLGIGEPVPVSAASRLGIGDLLDEVVKHFDGEKIEEEEDDRPRIAVVGKMCIRDRLDTPGILWPKFEDQAVGLKLALIGSINDQILNKDDLACRCIRILKERYPGMVSQRFGLETEDKEPAAILEDVARLRSCLMKGGELDLSLIHIYHYFTGAFRLFFIIGDSPYHCKQDPHQDPGRGRQSICRVGHEAG